MKISSKIWFPFVLLGILVVIIGIVIASNRTIKIRNSTNPEVGRSYIIRTNLTGVGSVYYANDVRYEFGYLTFTSDGNKVKLYNCSFSIEEIE